MISIKASCIDSTHEPAVVFENEVQRLKDEEHLQFGGSVRRDIAKINYRIHTDAIKELGVLPIHRKSFSNIAEIINSKA